MLGVYAAASGRSPAVTMLYRLRYASRECDPLWVVRNGSFESCPGLGGHHGPRLDLSVDVVRSERVGSVRARSLLCCVGSNGVQDGRHLFWCEKPRPLFDAVWPLDFRCCLKWPASCGIRQSPLPASTLPTERREPICVPLLSAAFAKAPQLSAVKNENSHHWCEKLAVVSSLV
jgi:hypothetical protein